MKLVVNGMLSFKITSV